MTDTPAARRVARLKLWIAYTGGLLTGLLICLLIQVVVP